MRPQIYLFDVDGVLVKPAGYQLAMEATCRSFLCQAGLESHVPDNNVYLGFESQKVTSEWDMVPLALLIVFDRVAQFSNCPEWVNDLSSAIRWCKGLDLPDFHVHYLPVIQQMGLYIQPGKTAAEGILNAIESGQSEDLLLHIRKTQLIRSLLSTTRRMHASETTRKFQEYTLGWETYTRVYQSEPGEFVDSFLLKYDEAILQPSISKALYELNAKNLIRSAVYTARPSLAPKEVVHSGNDYSPEAELALRLVGLENLPLIGYGKLAYLAGSRETTIPMYIKPAGGQAVAAMAAAWTGNEWDALCWAADLLEGRLDHQAVSLPEELDLYIFEDSPAGILGGKAAVDILKGIGITVHYHPIGIASNNEKTSKLTFLGARIYENINLALKDIVGIDF